MPIATYRLSEGPKLLSNTARKPTPRCGSRILDSAFVCGANRICYPDGGVVCRVQLWGYYRYTARLYMRPLHPAAFRDSGGRGAAWRGVYATAGWPA